MVRVLLIHSDGRSFEVERFGAAWRRAGGAVLTGGPGGAPARYGQERGPGAEPHIEVSRLFRSTGLEPAHRRKSAAGGRRRKG